MRHFFWATAIMVSTPLLALAGEAPRVDVFGGYSFTRSSEETLHGWGASLALNLSDWFGVVADISGHYATIEGTDVSRYFFLAGPRLSRRGDGVTFFVQALVGSVRTSAGIQVLGVSISQKSTDPGGTLGAGLEVKVAGNWAARLQGELALVKGEDGTEKEPRASVGIVYRMGKR